MIVVCAGNENGRKIGSYMKHTSRTHTHTRTESVCERKITSLKRVNWMVCICWRWLKLPRAFFLQTYTNGMLAEFNARTMENIWSHRSISDMYTGLIQAQAFPNTQIHSARSVRCVRVHKCESSKSALPDGFCFKRVAGITMVTAGHTSWFIYVAFATHTSTTHSTRTKGNALSQTLDIHHTHTHTVYQNHTHALSLPCTLARSLHCPIIYDNHRTAYGLFAWRTVLA